MIQAVVFDCFGVIITDALQAICDRLRETNPAAADEIGNTIKASNRGLIPAEKSNKYVAGLLGIPVEAYRQQIIDGEFKDQKLLKFIRNLRPHYKTALLSNIGAQSLHKRFTDHELLEHFDVVIASGDVGCAKPEPEIYEMVVERLGVPVDSCIFTDDRLEFCEAAERVGMHAIHFKSSTQFEADLVQLLNQFEK